MGIQDELSQIESRFADSDDIQELAQVLARCETILANATKAMAGEADPAMRQTIEEMRQGAQDLLARVKTRFAQVKVARMDPDYEKNKGAEAERRQQKQTEDLKKAQQFLAGGGLGNLLGGLMGAAAGFKGMAETPGAPSQLGSACPKCGAQSTGGKFCPECGAPTARNSKCPGCGSQLAAGAKFCPECGAKAA